MSNENETSKSIVTSYRLSQDTKDKLQQQLKDLGMTQEQYFNKAVSMMELENVKQNNIFAVNTTELQNLTQRIYNLFIGLCEQGNSFLSNKDTELEDLKIKYKDMLLNKDNSITQQNNELQDVYSKLSILQNDNDNNKMSLDNIKLEYDKQLEQMEGNLADKTSLINEYKQKNDDLLSIVSEYKQYKAELEKYKKLLSDAQTINISLNDDIKNKDLNINELTKNLERLKQDNTNNLEKLQEELLFKQDKAILILQQDYQKNVEALNNSHIKEIQEYQHKYKELLDQLETKQNAPHKKNIKTNQGTIIQDSLLK